jgi:hypothetical protein
MVLLVVIRIQNNATNFPSYVEIECTATQSLQQSAYNVCSILKQAIHVNSKGRDLMSVQVLSKIHCKHFSFTKEQV